MQGTPVAAAPLHTTITIVKGLESTGLRKLEDDHVFDKVWYVDIGVCGAEHSVAGVIAQDRTLHVRRTLLPGDFPSFLQTYLCSILKPTDPVCTDIRLTV